MVQMADKALLKAIEMMTRRVCVLVFILVIGCQYQGVGQTQPVGTDAQAGTKADISIQLQLNREALLTGTTEAMRINAAMVMLVSEEEAARKILLDMMSLSDNSIARMAICKALIRCNSGRANIQQQNDFILPLLNIFSTEIAAEAKLAAEATLIFEYDELQEPLEKLAANTSVPLTARLNTIYALKLQPDMRAIFELFKLVDDAEAQVVYGAEDALKLLGIPIGKNTADREKIASELKQKGRNAFLLERLIRKEAEAAKLEAETENWQQLYLSALEQIYTGISEDLAKGEFLADYLCETKTAEKLWALDKVEQLRQVPGAKLSAELGPKLLTLISDADREVRFRTAKLLSFMSQLDSSQKLMEQYQAEQDKEVKTNLFVALGWACYYASLPDSNMKISPKLKKQTLEWAEDYLFENNAENARRGAEVIKKLLEQDELESVVVEKTLAKLSERYNQEKDNPDGILRAELLNVMADLCARSVHKEQAVSHFSSLFKSALQDQTNSVREAAVNGLIYADKAEALDILRAFINDNSPVIIGKIIELANEVGGKEDLDWLAEKLVSSTDQESAWGAMLGIFEDSEIETLKHWVARFAPGNGNSLLTNSQHIVFLEIAERKATEKNEQEMLNGIRKKLAQLYFDNSKFGEAAKCWGLLFEAAGTAAEKEAISDKLLSVYLRVGNFESAAQIVAYRLSLSDMAADNNVIQLIDNYLNTLSAGVEPNTLLGKLTSITIPTPTPLWDEQLKKWTETFVRFPEAGSVQ